MAIFSEIIEPLKNGNSVGIISEAGCPAIADPGSDVVALAQSKKYKVVPLVGPSSIIMSVMGSGFNGQSFAFNGYLPVEVPQRIKALKKLENKVWNEDQTQSFIETPYRKIDPKTHKVTDIVEYMSADVEDNYIIAQASEPMDENGEFIYPEYKSPIDRIKAELEPLGYHVFPISTVTGEGVNDLINYVYKILHSKYKKFFYKKF